MPYVITCKSSSRDIYYISRDIGRGENNSTYRVRTQLIGKALVFYNVKAAMRVLKEERDRINGYTDYKVCNIMAYPLEFVDEAAALAFCNSQHGCENCPASCNPDIRSAYEKDVLSVPCFVNLMSEDSANSLISDLQSKKRSN